MKETIIIIEIIILTVLAYASINYKSIISHENRINLSGIIPKGWKQIVCYVAIPISLTAVAYMLNSFYSSDVIFTTKRLLLLAILWPIAVYDYREYRIPNKLIIVGFIGRAFILIFELFFRLESILQTLINEGIAFAGAIVVCLICMLLSRGSLGMGDLKLTGIMALLLGTEGICYSMFVSIFIAFIIAVILLISRKKGRKDHMPFAPSILVGTFVSLILSGV